MSGMMPLIDDVLTCSGMKGSRWCHGHSCVRCQIIHQRDACFVIYQNMVTYFAEKFEAERAEHKLEILKIYRDEADWLEKWILHHVTGRSSPRTPQILELKAHIAELRDQEGK